MNSSQVFFQDFLKISDYRTLIFIGLLFCCFFIMYKLGTKKVDFSKKIIVGMILGLGLGFIFQFVSGFSDNPSDITFVSEATSWFSLFGNGYMDLIRMIVIPLVMISIVHVIINMEENAKIGKLVKNTVIVTMSMVTLSAVIGIVVGLMFNLGAGLSYDNATAEIKEVKPIVTTLRALIPSNPVKAMVDLNIIGIVIFSIFFAIGGKRMSKKHMEVVKPFFDLTNALHKIVISVALSIIKFMPYAIIPLLANTLALRGLSSILEVGLFIVALYVAIILMFIIQLLLLSLNGLNPVIFIKKSMSVLILAFTSRSSVGTLPATIETLTRKLGVNDGSASFVASFGTTAGMQGCAGVFPALLIIFVSNLNNIPIDFTLIIMSIIVISIGSIGIAGIPGTATMSASVALSGTGLSAYFTNISPILAIDPLIDMGRTFLNVSGAMVNAIVVDKSLNQLNIDEYNNLDLPKE